VLVLGIVLDHQQQVAVLRTDIDHLHLLVAVDVELEEFALAVAADVDRATEPRVELADLQPRAQAGELALDRCRVHDLLLARTSWYRKHGVARRAESSCGSEP
jgi:hypothetical protein